MKIFELDVKDNKLRLIEHCKYKNNNIKKKCEIFINEYNYIKHCKEFIINIFLQIKINNKFVYLISSYHFIYF